VAAQPTHALAAQLANAAAVARQSSPTAAQQVAAQKPANGAAAALLKNSRSTASNSPQAQKQIYIIQKPGDWTTSTHGYMHIIEYFLDPFICMP
jgi:predicted KAP-like P-loop ATPase